jgi:hypothetical protein
VMPSPVTNSGLYGWLCIGWVMVNFICRFPSLSADDVPAKYRVTFIR